MTFSQQLMLDALRYVIAPILVFIICKYLK